MIKKLPDEIISRISAGEVITSPYNAIKELIENSIDANSTKISLDLSNTLLNFKITDNGKGIDENDFEKLCWNHFSSKIETIEDLKGIGNFIESFSFGFRGEALHSISLCSRISVISKTEQDQIGHMAEYNGSELLEIKKYPRDCSGTTISVDDLFFNNLLRKNAFFKNKTEINDCIELIKSYGVIYKGLELKISDKIIVRSDDKQRNLLMSNDFIKVKSDENERKISSSIEPIQMKAGFDKPDFKLYEKTINSIMELEQINEEINTIEENNCNNEFSNLEIDSIPMQLCSSPGFVPIKIEEIIKNKIEFIKNNFFLDFIHKANRLKIHIVFKPQFFMVFSSPEFLLKKNTNIIFINNRLVKFHNFKKRINQKYKILSKKDCKTFFYIEIFSRFADVNIHPSKSEVLIGEEEIFDQIINEIERKITFDPNKIIEKSVSLKYARDLEFDSIHFENNKKIKLNKILNSEANLKEAVKSSNCSFNLNEKSPHKIQTEHLKASEVLNCKKNKILESNYYDLACFNSLNNFESQSRENFNSLNTSKLSLFESKKISEDNLIVASKSNAKVHGNSSCVIEEKITDSKESMESQFESKINQKLDCRDSNSFQFKVEKKKNLNEQSVFNEEENMKPTDTQSEVNILSNEKLDDYSLLSTRYQLNEIQYNRELHDLHTASTQHPTSNAEFYKELSEPVNQVDISFNRENFLNTSALKEVDISSVCDIKIYSQPGLRSLEEFSQAPSKNKKRYSLISLEKIKSELVEKDTEFFKKMTFVGSTEDLIFSQSFLTLIKIEKQQFLEEYFYNFIINNFGNISSKKIIPIKTSIKSDMIGLLREYFGIKIENGFIVESPIILDKFIENWEGFEVSKNNEYETLKEVARKIAIKFSKIEVDSKMFNKMKTTCVGTEKLIKSCKALIELKDLYKKFGRC